jgi:lysozyme
MRASTRVALEKQIILHEGRRRFAYMDSVGKITVGCGRNLSDKGLSDAEIDYLLKNDIEECINDLISFPWFVEADPIRQRVAVDLRLNLGPTKFRTFKRFLAGMAERDYDKAATALRHSLWAGQVKTRANRLIQMLRSGEDYTA